MVRYILFSIAILIIACVVYFLIPKAEYSSDERTVAEGKELFKKHCASCHGLQDDGIGPPLGGITTLLSKEELTDFINDPTRQIESGKERAKALHDRYKLLMPSYAWMGEIQVNAILSYIDQQSRVHQIEPTKIITENNQDGLTGTLARPIQKSGITITLDEIIQLPQQGSSTDLGVVTLRAHPSGDGTLFASDQNGVIYRIKDKKAEVFLNIREHVVDFQSGPGIATGIGSFDFHPDFLNNGLIYISHAETFKGQPADYTISDSIKSEVQGCYFENISGNTPGAAVPARAYFWTWLSGCRFYSRTEKK